MGRTTVRQVGIALSAIFVSLSCGVHDSDDFDKGETNHGLTGTYYNNRNFTSKVYVRDDPTINFNWGDGSPAGGVGSDTFSVRWEGFIQPQFSETYTFYTHADDGVRLWVDGEQLINDWSDHGPRTRSGDKQLVAGQFYEIRLEYYENRGGAVAELAWSSPSQSKQIIPRSRLFTEISGPPGETLTLYPVADAYVNQSESSTNFGGESHLYIDTMPENMRSLLRFSVPSLDSEIESVTLRLFVTNAGNRPELYRTSNGWSENGVTWNNKPSPNGSNMANLSGDVPTGWLELDVTDAINNSGNYSFLLIPSNNNGVDFDSREGTNKPELIVTTSDDVDVDGCTIDGVTYSSGDVNNDNPCEHCAPSQSTNDWSPRPEGTVCGDGMICDPSGTCSGVGCTGECAEHCGPGVRTERDTVQIFYYPWYGSRSQDGRWRHWNANRRIGGGAYDPEADDLPAAFYPRLGPYSSTDPEVIDQHMNWIDQAGIGVVIISWWGQDSFEDRLVWDILHAADDYGLKVAFYIEPYDGGYRRNGSDGGTRTPQTAKEDVKYIIDKYGCHRAIHRVDGRPVFLFFAARTYMDGEQEEWNIVWDELHNDPDYNPIVIAHDTRLDSRIQAGGWDGGHDYGCGAAISQHGNWPELAAEYAAADRMFYFTVCPGYDKSRMSPGTDPVIEREDGALYDRLWQAVLDSPTRPAAVVINSFNEWHEGSSIEPAIPWSIRSYTYEDYEGAWDLSGSAAATAYLDRTRHFSDQFLE